MKEMIIDKPLETIFETPLFEYEPIKKPKFNPNLYKVNVKKYFSKSFNLGNSFLSKTKSWDSSSFDGVQKKLKNVVVKNIGNMTMPHLVNALNYTINKSAKNNIDLFGEKDKDLMGAHCGIDNCYRFVDARDVLADWEEELGKNNKGNVAMHLVFSLDEAKTPMLMETMLAAVKETMQENFLEYKYVLVPHSHQNKPHIHCIVNKTNIFNNKRLHFASKQECANFFHNLRESFKDNLYSLSQGKIDYANNLRANLDAKEKELAGIEDIDSDKLKDDLEYLKYYKEGMEDNYTRLKSYKGRLTNLEKEIRNKSIYLKNIQTRIKKLEADGKSFSLLLNKKRQVFVELSALSQAHTHTKQSIESIEAHNKKLLDSEDVFKRFGENFDKYNKAKTILNAFRGFERYLSSKVISKINLLKKQCNDFDSGIQNSLGDISDVMALDAQNLSDKKGNSFKIVKLLSKIKYYKGVVDSIEEETTNIRDNKQKSLKEFAEIKNRLIENLKSRAKFAFGEVTRIIEQNAQENNPKAAKNLEFLQKEYKCAQKALKQEGIIIEDIKIKPTSAATDSPASVSIGQIETPIIQNAANKSAQKQKAKTNHKQSATSTKAKGK